MNVPNAPTHQFNHRIHRDYANVVEEEEHLARTGTTVEAKFPPELHAMLSYMELNGLHHIASWRPHGRSFRIHDKKRFTKLILPLWFRQSRFASFQRMLRIYGFNSITTGADKGAHYHELFLRGKSFLAQRIDRKDEASSGESRQKGLRRSVSPDLYSLPFLPPTAAAAAAAPPVPTAAFALVPMMNQDHQGVLRLPLQGLTGGGHGRLIEDAHGDQVNHRHQHQPERRTVAILGLVRGIGVSLVPSSSGTVVPVVP